MLGIHDLHHSLCNIRGDFSFYQKVPYQIVLSTEVINKITFTVIYIPYEFVTGDLTGWRRYK